MEDASKTHESNKDLGGAGLDAAALLEQKKQEIIAASGGVYALKEAISAHGRHVEKVKGEVQEAVSSGKLPAEVANLILTQVARTRKVLDECLSSFKSRYDIKTGEALAYDNIARKSRQQRTPDPDPASAPPPLPSALEPEPAPAPVDPPTPAAEKPTPRGKGSRSRRKKEEQQASPAFTFDNPPAPTRKRERPDARGKVGDTVRRLKEARKSRENVEGVTKSNS